MAAPEPTRRVPLSSSEALAALYGPSGALITPRSLDGDTAFEDTGIPPKPEESSGPPRAFAPRMSTNISRSIRSEHLSAFDTLRFLSDFDLVRLAINDVKGQIRGMAWEVRVKKEHAEQSAALAPVVDAVRLRVEHPDPLGGFEFDDWLGNVLEDVLVLDALTVYPQRSLSGDPIGAVQIDGATIKPLLDDFGRPPLPPLPAYEQIIRGSIEREFSMGELWYMPRNRRSNSPYGRSPVEDVMVTVNLAIRTNMHELAYYTDGNMPDALYTVPDSWSPSQIREFQSLWDDVLGGKSQRRAGGLRFMPGGDGAGYTATKEHRVTYDQLEWLGRVISWAFGVSPMPIAKMQNRSTADAMEQSTAESGVRPLAAFVARVINRWIREGLGVHEVEFAWGEDETEDPALAYQRNVAYVNAGIINRDEVRQQIGLDPLADAEGVPLNVPASVTTPTGIIFVEDVIEERALKQMQREDTQARIDPRLVQRAFLEVPVLTRDELRASLGLPAVGGTMGGEYVTIAVQGVTPLAATATGNTEPASRGPQTANARSAAAATADASLKRAIAATAAQDIERWRRVALRCVKESKAIKRFESSAISEFVRTRLVSRLALAKTSGDVAAAFSVVKAGDPAIAGQADAQAQLFEILSVWIEREMPEWIAWALAELATSTAKVQKIGALPTLTMPQIDAVELFPDLVNALTYAAKAGSADALASAAIDLDYADPETLQYVYQRGAELVGRKWIDGSLQENPDAKWNIGETLRSDISAKTYQAIEQGWSPGKLTAELRDALGSARAETIARTETALAYGYGAQEAYTEAGVEYVTVLDGSGCLPGGHSDGAPRAVPSQVGIVQEEAEANGQIWTVDQYRQKTIGHPRCVRGTVVYFVAQEGSKAQ